jgi:hypothetical protein
MALGERERVRHLLALDAAAVMRRLNDRRDEMVTIFSRQRDREALVSPMRSTLSTMRFSEIVRLTLREQKAVFEFHEALDDLHWYLRYTVDMPGTLEMRLQFHLKLLNERHGRLVDVLGPVTEQDLDADMPVIAPPKRRKKATAARRTKPSKRR